MTVTTIADFIVQDYAKCINGITAQETDIKKGILISEGMLQFPLKHGNFEGHIQFHDSMNL